MLRKSFRKIAISVAAVVLAQAAQAQVSPLFQDGVEYTYNSLLDAYEVSGYELAQLPQEVTIPERLDGRPIVSLRSLAFRNCATLKRINLPVSLRFIGYGAFRGCSSLCGIDLSNTAVERVENSTFYGCVDLRSVKLGNTVSEIEASAFALCDMVELHCSRLIPPVAYEGTFDYIEHDNVTVYVPEIAIDVYRAHDEWNRFVNYEPISTSDDDEMTRERYDVNADGAINTSDVTVLIGEMINDANSEFDFTTDGVVDALDLDFLIDLILTQEL